MRISTETKRITARRTLLSLGVIAAGAAVASPAAAVPCNDLNLPNPIYGTGGSAITATLKNVAVAIAGLRNPPLTILWSDTLSACPGYEEFLNNSITPTTIRYWQADGTELTCEPPLTGGQPADFAHTGNPVDTCPGQPARLPSGVGHFPAPVQTINAITHIDSNQTTISAEALYFIYRDGAQSGVSPWTNEAGIMRRQPGAFLSLFFGEGINLAPPSFFGTEYATQGNLISAIVTAGATIPRATIGFVSGSAADAQRGLNTVKTLAFQYVDQTCAYLPDSDETSFDKINVRKGQYHFWTPGHFYGRVNNAGDLENPLVEQLFGWFSGAIDGPGGINVTEIIAKSGDVPVCAMQVTREGLAGAISSFAPTTPCGCSFEVYVNGTTDCESCSRNSDCAGDGEKCRAGYCEPY